MSSLGRCGSSVIVRNTLIVLIPLVVFALVPRCPGDRCASQPGIDELMASRDPFDRIAREVTLRGLVLHEAPSIGFDPREVDVCLHPDTKPEDAERLLRELPTYTGVGDGLLGYWIRGRWTWTAVDGGTGSQGDPITITWSFVPDGTWADGGSSDLFAVFDAAFGGSGWMNKIRNAFDRWAAAIGIEYIEVSDDGANMPGSNGQLGVRGDVRIGGRYIDGPGNVLAYDYYPSAGGDMVLDTGDDAFYSNPVYNYANLKNVVAHEHGHGIGLGHVIPNDCTKLMEAYHCGGAYFIGPQDDDIRGGMRNYGDPYENNDTNAEPTDLGTIGSDTLVVENLSIDRGTTDIDWYLVTLSGTNVTVEVDPVGSTYLLGEEGGSTSWVSTDSISDPDIELYDALGTTLLASATSGGLGETEVLNHTVASVGDYQIKVYRKADSGSGVQRYTMTIYLGAQGSVPYVDGDGLAGTGLAFSVYPNPFGAEANMKFFAPSPGAYQVDVFDVAGRRTRTIEASVPRIGWTELAWDGRDDRGDETASGVYFVRVSTGERSEIKRLLRVR
jgi:hypothetical protein